jgi:hypothetical protein
MTPQEFTQFMTLLCGQTETPHEAAFYPHMAMSKPKMAYWYKELHSFPLAVCCTALERYYDTGEDERLLGVGFLLTPCVMKPCAYLRHSLPPPLWVASSRLWKRLGDLRVWCPSRGPGFRDETPLRPWFLAQQRRHNQIPSPTKHPDQTPASCPWPAGSVRTPPRAIAPCAVGHRLIRLAAHPHQPQRRPRDGHPPPRGPLRIRQARALPWPTAAFGHLEAWRNPGPQPLPGGLTGFGRPIGHQQPRVLGALVPARQQGTVQAPRFPRKGRPAAGP